MKDHSFIYLVRRKDRVENMKEFLVVPVFVVLILAFIVPSADATATLGKVNDKFTGLDNNGNVIVTIAKSHHFDYDTVDESTVVIEKEKYKAPNTTGHEITWNFANTGLVAQTSYPDQDGSFPTTTDWQIKISAKGEATFTGIFQVLIG